MHEQLLEIASELANRERGPPRSVSLKRSVSTAYYALFHAVAAFCATQLVGAYRPWKPLCHVCRSLEHGPARKIFESLDRTGEFGVEARRIGKAFLVLQKLRHSADYDIAFRIGRNETFEAIERARQAISLLDHLGPSEGKLLAARLIGRPRAS